MSRWSMTPDMVHLRPVTIANDLGATLEIAQGVSADDRIVINPPDSLINGERVTIAPAEAAAK